MKKITCILLFVLILTSCINSNNSDFDTDEAKSILDETWKPLQHILEKNSTSNSYYIDSKEYFIESLSTMTEGLAVDIFDTITEDTKQGIIISDKVFFPLIFDEEVFIEEAYIRPDESNREKKQLVIKETGRYDNLNILFKRVNILEQDENDNWILQYITGNLSYSLE